MRRLIKITGISMVLCLAMTSCSPQSPPVIYKAGVKPEEKKQYTPFLTRKYKTASTDKALQAATDEETLSISETAEVTFIEPETPHVGEAASLAMVEKEDDLLKGNDNTVFTFDNVPADNTAAIEQVIDSALTFEDTHNTPLPHTEDIPETEPELEVADAHSIDTPEAREEVISFDAIEKIEETTKISQAAAEKYTAPQIEEVVPYEVISDHEIASLNRATEEAEEEIVSNIEQEEIIAFSEQTAEVKATPNTIESVIEKTAHTATEPTEENVVVMSESVKVGAQVIEQAKEVTPREIIKHEEIASLNAVHKDNTAFKIEQREIMALAEQAHKAKVENTPTTAENAPKEPAINTVSETNEEDVPTAPQDVNAEGVIELPKEPEFEITSSDASELANTVAEEEEETIEPPAQNDAGEDTEEKKTTKIIIQDPSEKSQDGTKVATTYTSPHRIDGYSLKAFVDYALEKDPSIILGQQQTQLQSSIYDELLSSTKTQVTSYTNITGQYNTSGTNDSRLDDTTRFETGVNINRTLYSFGASKKELAASGANILQSEMELEDLRNSVAFEVATAYLEGIRQRELVLIEKYRLAEHENFLKLVEKAEETNQVLKSQVFLARTGLAQRKQALLEAERVLKGLEYTLERHINRDVDMDRLTKPVIPIIVLPDEEEFIATGFEISPEIRALQEAMFAAKHQYEALSLSKYGSVGVRTEVTSDRPINAEGDDRTPTLSMESVLEYSVPLYTSGGQAARARQALIELEQARTSLDQAKQRMREQLKLAYYTIKNVDKVRELAKQEEESALKVLEYFRGEVQHGGRAFSDILAQIDAVAAGRNRQISSETSKILAAYAIMKHQGDLLYYMQKK